MSAPVNGNIAAPLADGYGLPVPKIVGAKKVAVPSKEIALDDFSSDSISSGFISVSFSSS